MLTLFKYSKKVIANVYVPSLDFVKYNNDNKDFIKVEGNGENGSYSVMVPINKKNSFQWKHLPEHLRKDADFKKFCKKVCKFRGFM